METILRICERKIFVQHFLFHVYSRNFQQAINKCFIVLIGKFPKIKVLKWSHFYEPVERKYLFNISYSIFSVEILNRHYTSIL